MDSSLRQTYPENTKKYVRASNFLLKIKHSFNVRTVDIVTVTSFPSIVGGLCSNVAPVCSLWESSLNEPLHMMIVINIAGAPMTDIRCSQDRNVCYYPIGTS